MARGIGWSAKPIAAGQQSPALTATRAFSRLANRDTHDSLCLVAPPRLGDEAAVLPALDLGQVRVGAPVHHHLVHDLVGLLRRVPPRPPHLAHQPHAQRDVHALCAVGQRGWVSAAIPGQPRCTMRRHMFRAHKSAGRCVADTCALPVARCSGPSDGVLPCCSCHMSRGKPGPRAPRTRIISHGNTCHMSRSQAKS